MTEHPTRRRAPCSNPNYRLTEVKRVEIGLVALLGLWTDSYLAEFFGVSRKTISNLRARALERSS